MSRLSDFLSLGTGRNFDLISQNLGDVSGTVQLDLSQYDVFNFTPIAPTTITFSGISTNTRRSGHVQLSYGGTDDISWDSRVLFDMDYVGVFSDVVPGSIDLSTVAFEEESPFLSNGIFDFDFKNDGTKLFIVDNGTKSLRQYSLSIPYDITTATNDNVQFDLTGQNNFNSSIFLKDDGTKVIVNAFSTPQAGLYEYTLSTPWDVSTMSYSGKSFTIGNDSTSNGYMSNDGTSVYLINTSTKTITRYDFSTPWDVSTCADSGISFTLSESYNTTYDIEFINSGEQMILVATDTSDNAILAKYSLDTAFDITTLTFIEITPSPIVGNTANTVRSLRIRESDDSIFVGEYTDGVISRHSYADEDVGSTKATIKVVQNGDNQILASLDSF